MIADRNTLADLYYYFSRMVDVTRPLVDDTIYKRIYKSVDTVDQELIAGVAKAN